MMRKIAVFAVLYTIVSMAIEASLIIFAGLRVPGDNAVIAPVILTIPPLIIAYAMGFRAPKPLLAAVILIAFTTLSITLVFVNLTGVSTGLVEPAINRTLAGFVSAYVLAKYTKI